MIFDYTNYNNINDNDFIKSNEHDSYEYFKANKNEYSIFDNNNNNESNSYHLYTNYYYSDSEQMCSNFLRKNSDEDLMRYYPDDDLYEKHDDNHFDLNNINIKIFQGSEIDNDLRSTQEKSEHSFTENKINTENIWENKSDTENKNIIDNSNNNKETKMENKKKQKKVRGRKQKKFCGGEKHTKSDDDNIMRKLKTKLFKFILDDLNKSFKYTKYKFLPLTPKLNVSLEKETNVALFNRTIEDIFGNTILNETYDKKGLNNKKLIEKILKENKETETIKLLSMTFKEFLNDIRENRLEEFLKSIQDKEEKNAKMNESEEEMQENVDEDFDIKSFMIKVKKLLNNYENWFIDKIGRNNKTKKK